MKLASTDYMMPSRNDVMYILAVAVCSEFTVITANECTHYTDLPNVNRRSPLVTYDPSIPAISDNIGFVEGWYRAGDSDIPTTKPPENRCGTVYPFYLDAEIPTDDTVLETRACLGDTTQNCYYYINIKVKNCGLYRVYYLVPIGFNSAAYCFQYVQTNQVPTEHFTKADANYHSLIWQVEDGEETPRILFECNFAPLYNASVLYAVTWKLNNNTKIGETKVVNLTELEEAYLNEKEITDAGYRHGIILFCEVGARYERDGITGPITTGSAFFAGIQIRNQSATLKSGKFANIEFELTAPFACGSGEGDTCKLSIQMLDPRDTSTCKAEIAADSSKCFISFEGKSKSNVATYYISNDWKHEEVITLKQTETTKSIYRETHLTLSLITSEVKHLFWSNTRLPDISVNIDHEDKAWKNQICSAYADPHLHTFDKMYYEQQFPGEFIFYRNGKQEVQYKTQNCFSERNGPTDTPFCVCGIAARAGHDVFVFDICNRKNIINFRLCEDSTLTVKSNLDTEYQVLFPTGTELKISRNKNYPYLNIRLYPSVSDSGNAEGLCGNLDGDCTNDLKERGETVATVNTHCGPWPYKYPNKFTKSWQVNDTETLFKLDEDELKLLKPWDTSALFCKCLRATDNRSHLPADKADCSYDEYTDCEKYTRLKPFLCYIKKSKRKKRDIKNQLLQNSAHENLSDKKRHHRSITDMMSVEEATFHCEKIFNESVASQVCMDNVGGIDYSYVQMCTADLQLTGNVSLAEEALQVLKEDCVTWTRKNGTFVSNFPDVANIIYTTTCLNNCSNQGSCVNGDCYCKDGYTGTDCSQDKTTPPTITTITDNGLCDTSEEQCQDVFIYGENFFSTNLTKCKFETQMTMVDNSTTHKGDTIVDGTQISVFEAVCVPPQETDSSIFYLAYNISVSNDGVSYSNQMSMYIFDSTCQNVTSNTGVISITLMENFCFIDRICVIEGTKNIQNRCRICDSSKSKFDWSNISGCDIVSTSTETSGTTFPSIISTPASSLMSSPGQSFTSGPFHTISSRKSSDDENDKDENGSVNVVIIIVPVAAVIAISIMTIIVVKIKIKANKTSFREETPEAKVEEIHYPDILHGDTSKTNFISNIPPSTNELFQPSTLERNRPASALTISPEFLNRDTYNGPDLSMFLVKRQ